MKNMTFDLAIKKIRLDNGLDVIFYRDKSLPLVAVNIWYKVGSANESPGKTGFAHLFEHMMFQGSLNVPKEMHFKYIQEAGGTLNGSTSMDRTNYYEKVPADFLELVLWLESDRMGFLLPALTKEKLDNQKDVVMNERRQRYENQPYGRAWEILFSNTYPESHPYSWPTIGWMKDIENFELNDIKNFFETYYAPNNASLVIAGDFDYQPAYDLVKKYFDEIPEGKMAPQIVHHPPALEKEKFVEYEDSVELPRLYMAWHSDRLYGEDDAALDIIADLLANSKNSRLYKTLVFDKQIAQDISCFQYSGRLNGCLIIICTAKPGISLKNIKREILNEIEYFILKGITREELSRSVNSIKSSFVYSLQNLDVIANQINNYNCNLGEPDSFEMDVRRYEEYDSAEIGNIAGRYLANPHVELNIIPKNKK